MDLKNIKLCKLCDECGFVNDSQVGVLKEELGLSQIIESQTIFPCHLHLKAYNGTENTGTHEMVADKGEIYVCSGYVQSLVKSHIPPRNAAMKHLMRQVDKIDPRIMTIDDTKEYHKGK